MSHENGKQPQDLDTVGEWLESLANTNSSSEQDSFKMMRLLRKIGFPNAVVICGIVYLEGKGTIEAPPTGLHSLAAILVKHVGARK